MREITFNSVQHVIQKITVELLPLNPSAAARQAGAAPLMLLLPARGTGSCLQGVWAAACLPGRAESVGLAVGLDPSVLWVQHTISWWDAGAGKGFRELVSVIVV